MKRAATTCRSRKAALLRLYTTPRLSALENRRRADCHAGLITDSQWRQMLLPRPILPSPSCLCEPAPLHLCGNPYPLPSAPFLFIAAVFLQTTGSASGLQYQNHQLNWWFAPSPGRAYYRQPLKRHRKVCQSHFFYRPPLKRPVIMPLYS